MAKEKVMISIDGELQEAKGEVLEELLQAQKDVQLELERIEKEQIAKKEARENALKKLAEIAGLTDEEIAAII